MSARIGPKNAFKSIQMEKENITLSRPRFASQWAEYEPTVGQVFILPSETVPDQSLTIPEIIAKFTRTGMVPGTMRLRDQGGNVAADPEFDPLDDYGSVMKSAAAARNAANSGQPGDEVTHGEARGEALAPAPAGA